jgi:hypothetical protein
VGKPHLPLRRNFFTGRGKFLSLVMHRASRRYSRLMIFSTHTLNALFCGTCAAQSV